MDFYVFFKCGFLLTLAEVVTSFNAMGETNLSNVSWAHAVNTKQELFDALNSNVDMIEADIVLGTLHNCSEEEMPVMGHPPSTTSDISLDMFLKEILDFNQNHLNKTKGVKLDFKSTKVFTRSLSILKGIWAMVHFPIWLNADIMEGPLNQNVVNPVDPETFFNGCREFKNAILSVGWTTLWGPNYTDGSYSDMHVNKMIEIIKSNNITQTKHEITFPVRAGIAAQSRNHLAHLFQALNQTNRITLTIWSSKNDNVDISKLHDLILYFGVNNVYVDVPEEIFLKLHLDKNLVNLS